VVMPGQFLERATLIPVAGVVMEGVSHRGRLQPPLLVLPPRPEDGGGMDHVVGAELAWAASQAGHPTLRFNHRGVGASQGERSGGEDLVEDVLSALLVAGENAGHPRPAVAAAGGACATALEVLRRHPERISGVCLISPGALDAADVPEVGVPVLLVLGSEQPTVGRVALASAIAAAGGALELIEGADAGWIRGLPQLGQAVAAWLSGLGRAGGAIP